MKSLAVFSLLIDERKRREKGMDGLMGGKPITNNPLFKRLKIF
jgi:hypothetical protein